MRGCRTYRISSTNALMAAKPERFFEYWGQETSLLPIECQPLLRWRVASLLRGRGLWPQLVHLIKWGSAFVRQAYRVMSQPR